MECRQNSKEESYEFFENVVNYIEKTKSNVGPSNYEQKCFAFMDTSGSDFTVKETAKNICEQFIKLYYSLKDHDKCTSNGRPDELCSNFLIYWINSKLRKIVKEDNCVSDVYDYLEGQFTHDDYFNINIDVKYIYDINKDDMYKMNILYSLYEKYTDISAIIENTSTGDKELLSSLSTACCTVYLEANYMCNGDNNNNRNFCEKLKKFVSKYDELYGKLEEHRPDISDNFIKLSECPNTKIISTAVTGSIVGLIPLFGLLYKFTPLGQRFRSKIGILNNNVSNNDEEMVKISLMEQVNEPLKFQQGTYNIKYQTL